MRYPTRWVTWALILVPTLLLVGLWGGGSHVLPNGIRVYTRATENSIVAAIASFQTEYGHLPGNRPNGRYEDSAGNAQLFKVLRALDPVQNPRNIVYFEFKNARPPKPSFWHHDGKLRNGFDPQTGVLLDPYGSPYQIRMTPSKLQPISSPYHDAPAGENTILVWSLGPDGKPGNPTDATQYAGSDDILSWQNLLGR